MFVRRSIPILLLLLTAVINEPGCLWMISHLLLVSTVLLQIGLMSICLIWVKLSLKDSVRRLSSHVLNFFILFDPEQVKLMSIFLTIAFDLVLHLLYLVFEPFQVGLVLRMELFCCEAHTIGFLLHYLRLDWKGRRHKLTIRMSSFVIFVGHKLLPFIILTLYSLLLLVILVHDPVLISFVPLFTSFLLFFYPFGTLASPIHFFDTAPLEA